MQPIYTRRATYSKWAALGKSEDVVYANAFRVRRLAKFLSLADEVLMCKGTCRILDVGGEHAYWLGLEESWRGRNLEITLVNRGTRKIHDERFIYISGDARDLSGFADNSFDVVHSNSVIEHVGRWTDMCKMANEVRRLAPAYFIQTPNYWFPFEPHLRMPFIHWMPGPWQRRMVMARACGFYPKAENVDQAEKILSDASLLDVAAMHELFPDAEIMRERVGLLTKSLIAIRQRDVGRPSDD